jgi:hypothetical protein
MEEIKKKYSLSKGSLLQLGTTILGVFVSALATQVLKFSPARFLELGFWAETGINYVIMIIFYNYISMVVVTNEKARNDTSYYASVVAYAKLLDFISNKHLESLVEDMAEVEVNKNRINAANSMLRKITYKLRYNDLEELDEQKFDEYCSKNRLNKKERKELGKIIKQVINGRYDYERFTADDILTDADFSIEDNKGLVVVFNAKQFEKRENLKKSLFFIGGAAVVQAFVKNEGFTWDFLIALGTKAFLTASAGYSGMMKAKRYLKQRKLVIDNRILLLNKALAKVPATN